jgi:hypothetical protein
MFVHGGSILVIDVASTLSVSIGIYSRNIVGRFQVEHATTAGIMMHINKLPDGRASKAARDRSAAMIHARTDRNGNTLDVVTSEQNSTIEGRVVCRLGLPVLRA